MSLEIFQFPSACLVRNSMNFPSSLAAGVPLPAASFPAGTLTL